MCVREETGIKGGGGRGGVRVCVSGERDGEGRRSQWGEGEERVAMCVCCRCVVWSVVCGAGGAVCATRCRPDGGAPQTCACVQVSKNTAHKGTPVSVTAKTPPFLCFTSNACANELNIRTGGTPR